MLTDKLSALVPALALPENAGALSQLGTMIGERKLPHAVVFEGADGEQLRQLCLVTAQGYLCSCGHPLDGECHSCGVLSAYGAHPDLVVVEGSGASGAVSIASVRELHERAMIVPTDSDGTVFLLENCDAMLRPAQNAFLKLLEEPPRGVMFLMTCASRMNLLETVRSRVCIIPVKTVPAQNDEADDELAAFADDFAEALVRGSEGDALLLTGRFYQIKDSAAARRELLGLLEELREIFRQAAIIGAGAGQVLEAPRRSAEAISRSISPERLCAMSGELDGLSRAVRNYASMSLATSAVCVRLRRAAGI